MTDKILCPWCGHEMFVPRPWLKGTPDMEGHNWTVRAKCRNCNAVSPDGSGRTEQGALNDMMRIALRRYTPPLKPMTLEEFWKEDDPMWVEHKNGALYIGDFYASISAREAWDVHVLGSAKPRLLLEHYYGRTWRCWEREPTDEERSAAKWET